jgi:hypothetical protein
MIIYFYQLAPVKPFGHCFECGVTLQKDPKFKPTQYKCVNVQCAKKSIYYDWDKWAFKSAAWRVRRPSRLEWATCIDTIRTATSRILT